MKQAKEKLRKVTVMLPDRLVERAVLASGEGITITIRSALEKSLAAGAYERLLAKRGKRKLDPAFFEALRRDFE